MFIDPNHYEAGTFKGVRMISDSNSKNSLNQITLLGSDDGINFWKLAGRWTNKDTGALEIDFSPKQGPSDLSGKFECVSESACKITWVDDNFWTKISSVADLK